jgi:hypothetical protein
MAASNISEVSLGVQLAVAAIQYRGVQVTGAAVAAGGAGYIAQTGGAVGDRVAVTTVGTAIAEAGAAIAAGALVEFDSVGRVVTRTSGVNVGRLAPGESAAAAGQLVEMIVIPH